MSHRRLPAMLFVGALVVAPQAFAQITFYENEGFRGRSFTANAPINDFAGSGFNDRVSSAVVERGQWQVCEHAHFGGRCTVLRPGQYPSFGSFGFNDRVSSVRRVSGGPPPAAASAPPPAGPAYAYYPRHGERIYNANVTAVRAVVGPPEQRCWVERQQVGGGANVPGAVIGGILGGVLGHQVGSGRGNDVATAVGAVTGAAVGANVNRGPGYTQDVQRCSAVPGTGQVQYWDVTYVFRGQYHRAQLSFQPGPTIPVNGKGEPRV